MATLRTIANGLHASMSNEHVREQHRADVLAVIRERFTGITFTNVELSRVLGRERDGWGLGPLLTRLVNDGVLVHAKVSHRHPLYRLA